MIKESIYKESIYMVLTFTVFGLLVLTTSVSDARAQQLQPAQPGQAETLLENPQAEKPNAKTLQAESPQNPLSSGPRFNSDEYLSLVFTHWEQSAIEDARNSRGSVRPPTEEELARDLATRKDETEKVRPPPEEREIRLGGIVFNNSKDWTIWMNEQRVTPKALPEAVLDLKVYKTYIELKWFDEYTNQIFPIRLRAHQRFNIDSRIFLPG